MTACRLLRIATILMAIAFIGPTVSFAGQPEIYAGAIRGVAINGYDPVAYFTQEKAVAGSAEITTQWKGVIWRFASQANRDSFATEPEKYAPQYGGYCAYAVALGSTASTDPQAFSIVNGKLYLNNSMSVRGAWAKDSAGYISKGDANWPGVLK